VNSATKKARIAKACRQAGFPAPHFSPYFATIRIPLQKTPRTPELANGDFDKWCGDVSHAAVARFINAKMGTVYTVQDIWQMRRRHKVISARIRQLVRDHKKPIDPKQ
jgi:hypothetical protein